MNQPRAPGSALIACDSNDVVKTAKNPRKDRLLVQLPGLLAGRAAGAIGTLRGVDSDAPTLALDLPDGSTLELAGRRQGSSRAFMSLKANGDTLAVKDVFESLLIFEAPGRELTDEQAGEAGALKAPPDFEYGLSAVAAGAARAPRARSFVADDSSGEDEDDDDLMDDDAGPRRSSGRARKQVSYAVGDGEDDAEDDDEDDGGDFDLDDAVPLSPPPKPKGRRKKEDFDLDDEVPVSPAKPKPKPHARKPPPPKAADVMELSSDEAPPKRRKSAPVRDSDSDDEFEFDSQSPVKPRSSSGRARKAVVYAVDDEPAADDDSDVEFDDAPKPRKAPIKKAPKAPAKAKAAPVGDSNDDDDESAVEEDSDADDDDPGFE